MDADRAPPNPGADPMRRRMQQVASALIFSACLAGMHADAQSARAGYSSTALYNLANAYARDGKPGMAVVNYERARLLAPDDPVIEANLVLVRDRKSVV